jgi:hypothetical protein
MWPEEEKLVHHLVEEQKECISWVEGERGEFQQDFFPPVHIPMVPHTPWVYKISLSCQVSTTNSLKLSMTK